MQEIPRTGKCMLVSTGGDGQFTFCDRDYGEEDKGSFCR